MRLEVQLFIQCATAIYEQLPIHTFRGMTMILARYIMFMYSISAKENHGIELDRRPLARNLRSGIRRCHRVHKHAHVPPYFRELIWPSNLQIGHCAEYLEDQHLIANSNTTGSIQSFRFPFQ